MHPLLSASSTLGQQRKVNRAKSAYSTSAATPTTNAPMLKPTRPALLPDSCDAPALLVLDGEEGCVTVELPPVGCAEPVPLAVGAREVVRVVEAVLLPLPTSVHIIEPS
jgi:hypothetical protein